MPLIGVIDPSHQAAKRGTLGEKPPWLTVEQALAQAAEDPKHTPFPYEIVKAITDSHQERDYVSTSTLVSHCPRAEVLKRKAEYIGDLEESFVPWRGTAIHSVLEGSIRPGALAEYRFWTTIDGVEVSCSPDYLDADLLTDYKVVENPPRYDYPYPNHQEQVQINAFITRHAEAFAAPGGDRRDYVVDQAQALGPTLPFDVHEGVKQVGIIYLAPKYVKTMIVEHTILGVRELKAGPVLRKIRVPLVWPDKRVLALIKPRLEVLLSALESFPEFPAGAEDLWGGPPGWACPGFPLCKLPNCLAKRWPEGLTW